MDIAEVIKLLLGGTLPPTAVALIVLWLLARELIELAKAKGVADLAERKERREMEEREAKAQRETAADESKAQRAERSDERKAGLDDRASERALRAKEAEASFMLVKSVGDLVVKVSESNARIDKALERMDDILTEVRISNAGATRVNSKGTPYPGQPGLGT